MKCPCCGYNFILPKNKSLECIQMISKYKKDTQSVIKKAMRGIHDNVPSDKGVDKYYYFLFGIKEIDSKHIRWAVNVFLKKGYHLQGKGFQYLRSMIQNRNENHNKQKENERKSYGKTPRKRIVS
mgnify:FL=1